MGIRCSDACGVGTCLTFRRFCFNGQRIQDQGARVRRLIWVFAILMHVAWGHVSRFGAFGLTDSEFQIRMREYADS